MCWAQYLEDGAALLRLPDEDVDPGAQHPETEVYHLFPGGRDGDGARCQRGVLKHAPIISSKYHVLKHAPIISPKYHVLKHAPIISSKYPHPTDQTNGSDQTAIAF